MVVKRQCSFCAAEIEPGTGSMYVKRDGTVFHFCSSSCRKQQIHLGRVGHRFKWTRAHELKVAADRSTSARAAASAAAPVRRPGAGRGRRPAPAEAPAAPPAEPAALPAPTPAAPSEAPAAPSEAEPPAAEKPKPRARTRKKAPPPAESS